MVHLLFLSELPQRLKGIFHGSILIVWDWGSLQDQLPWITASLLPCQVHLEGRVGERQEGTWGGGVECAVECWNLSLGGISGYPIFICILISLLPPTVLLDCRTLKSRFPWSFHMLCDMRCKQSTNREGFVATGRMGQHLFCIASFSLSSFQFLHFLLTEEMGRGEKFVSGNKGF